MSDLIERLRKRGDITLPGSDSATATMCREAAAALRSAAAREAALVEALERSAKVLEDTIPHLGWEGRQPLVEQRDAIRNVIAAAKGDAQS
jgi:hypothetical protein